METISRSLLTFLVNSLWQIPLVAAVAVMACRFMRRGPAGHRHAVWVAALTAALLLPVVSVRMHPFTSAARLVSGPLDKFAPAPGLVGGGPAGLGLKSAPVARPPTARTISLAESTAAVLLGAYLLFILYRLARLALAIRRTVQIRRIAHAAEAPELLAEVWRRCSESFRLTGVELLFSPRITGPVTAGRTVILPESLLAETSADVLTTAIGHEMAHIARHDFAGNVLLEMLYLPVSFQPAAWLIRQGVERTREIACDELVTDRLLDAGVYARSILSLAAAMTPLPRPGYTLGVFDGDILEERIRRLVERPAANRQRARLLLVTGLSALGICAVLASTVAVNARAQSGAEILLKQGEAAYDRGDYAAAAAQFEAAARVEPANLKAKLSLADALLKAPGAPLPSNADSPQVARILQLYVDVLALDPRNKQANQGMLDLYLYTKQYAKAHDWALQAIGADASDASAYYAVAFADWSMAYPDYTAARQAAGMNLEFRGIIPDAGLRLQVRIQHMAQLEEGVNMLRTALDLDPEYSDAMAYMNLLLRIEAGVGDSTAQYDDLMSQADSWVTKAMAAKQKQLQNQVLVLTAPPRPPLPPPPPPRPPSGGEGLAVTLPAGSILVEGAAMRNKLVKETPPAYPELARKAGISGAVRLRVVVAKNGSVEDATFISGPALLATAAIQAVRQWVYQPTLVAGDPVEVVTTMDVNFSAERE